MKTKSIFAVILIALFSTNAEITIRDIMGNVVKKEKVLTNETEVVLDVKDLASGTYTIMISNDKTRVTKKLIKR